MGQIPDETARKGYEKRIAQLEEALQVIRKMWSEDAPAFQGKYYSIQDAFCNPRPDPLPPLLIGGSGRKKMLRLVAQYADMLNFNNVSVKNSERKLTLEDGRIVADVSKN